MYEFVREMDMTQHKKNNSLRRVPVRNGVHIYCPYFSVFLATAIFFIDIILHKIHEGSIQLQCFKLY